MKAVAAHYRQVNERAASPTASGVALPGQVHAVVLVSNLLAPTLRALAFAQATAPGDAARREGRRPRTSTTRCRANGRSAACRCRSS